MNFALLGYPLGHSLSPLIHKALFKCTKISGRYENREISPERLEKESFSDLDGCNVTIPYKRSIIPFLDDLSDEAKILGAVNTVKRTKEQFIGYNTDYKGFLNALDILKIKLEGHVAVTGYGGTARMMCHAAARQNCRISVLVREKSKPAGEELARELRRIYDRLEIAVETPVACDLILNATPAGMYPNIGEVAVSADLVAHTDAVFDAVYNPKETLLVKTAKAAGKKAESGMAMLVCQAMEAHKIWYGAEFSTSDMYTVMELADRELERGFKL